ncbi:lysophospholipase [Paraburkholderia sp. D15]|uniref:alpha/beta fold hydrolase n=1 Tax=Paraburkholderia sp. D15 TaxID=2880218 RepID=UPI0024786C0E|nr:alpha/beta fold hydrolase [Paraburkholderia sp. D15]WGS52024.1 lysophospholipase [Paraburkholderia sp. D15]WKF59704.1 2-succinyl-6-hydroxy-2,4-cyclohexadiene-1-carboxylate synthase [Paraburkholderia busanensis]
MSIELHAVMPIVVLLSGLAYVAWALAKGGPKAPPPMDSINSPFKSIDYSDLPPLEHFVARDQTALAYRVYRGRTGAGTGIGTGPGSIRGSVVLIHGSSASSVSMHTLAKALVAEAYDVYVPDVRGHGESGKKGTIAYIGQLEDDLSDFIDAVQPPGPRTLAGFSAGGGFVLRFAGDARQMAFDRYVLLAPLIHHNAASTRRGGGGWVNVGLPRTIALVILNQLRITFFNHLPTVAFALTPEAAAMLTPQYSYNLMQNFRPRDDYRATIRATRRPVEVLVGANDEAFYADQFAGVFAEAGRVVPVTIVPGVGHIGLTLEPAAVAEIVAAVSERQGEAVAS